MNDKNNLDSENQLLRTNRQLDKKVEEIISKK